MWEKGMSTSKKILSNMDELLEHTKKLSWEDVSSLLKVNKERARNVEALTLVGRLASRKIIPNPMIFPLIKAGWRFAQNLRIEDAGPNMFLFSFLSLEENERVLRLRQWNFKVYMMLLKEWKRGETIDEVELSHAQFWVQIHGLPLERLDEENALLLGTKLGSVDKVALIVLINLIYECKCILTLRNLYILVSHCLGKIHRWCGFLLSMRGSPVYALSMEALPILWGLVLMMSIPTNMR